MLLFFKRIIHLRFDSDYGWIPRHILDLVGDKTWTRRIASGCLIHQLGRTKYPFVQVSTLIRIGLRWCSRQAWNQHGYLAYKAYLHEDSIQTTMGLYLRHLVLWRQWDKIAGLEREWVGPLQHAPHFCCTHPTYIFIHAVCVQSNAHCSWRFTAHTSPYLPHV